MGLIQFVTLIGYPGLFAAVFFESGVFFGFFLPGSSMLFTAGLLASHGFFNIWILIPLLTLAAVLGDSAGYWFGNRLGVSLFFRNSRFFKHQHLERAKVFYEKHGMQAVMLARFIPIVRTFAPIIAGIARMRYRMFLMYNVAGAFLWAAGVTFAGYYLGAKIPFIDQYFTPIVLAIIVISMIPFMWELRKPRSENSSN
jgi:membrane-associated protein